MDVIDRVGSSSLGESLSEGVIHLNDSVIVEASCETVTSLPSTSEAGCEAVSTAPKEYAGCEAVGGCYTSRPGTIRIYEGVIKEYTEELADFFFKINFFPVEIGDCGGMFYPDRIYSGYSPIFPQGSLATDYRLKVIKNARGDAVELIIRELPDDAMISINTQTSPSIDNTSFFQEFSYVALDAESIKAPLPSGRGVTAYQAFYQWKMRGKHSWQETR